MRFTFRSAGQICDMQPTQVRMPYLLSLLVCFCCGLGCDNVQPIKTGDTDNTAASSTEQPDTLPEEDDTAPRQLASEPDATAQVPPTTSVTKPLVDAAESEEFQTRLLAKIKAGASTNAAPNELLQQLANVDTAIQELMSASASNRVDEQGFRKSGMQLGQAKLLAAELLSQHADASDKQRRSGQLAKLVALSHLSGFRDVDAAKELEKYAAELSQSADPDLAHQSRVVLLGFQLQDLQNGVTNDPADLLASADGLFTRPADLGFPELMTLLQASQILNQMGFADAAKRVDGILIENYRRAEDPRLRAEAWNVETRGSQAVENFVTAFNQLGAPGFDPQSALAAARGLLEAFPSVQTLEQMAGLITNVEYSGNVPLSGELARLVEQGLEQFPTASGNGVEIVRAILKSNRLRLSTVDQPLTLTDLVDFDGNPLQWSDYEGKVVLVDFWATWCTPCLNEIPEIRRVHQLLSDKGFAVLSVNMDENLPAAKEFVQTRNFPWKTYHSADAERLGFKSSFAETYGITAIPFMILVGTDGKVVDIHVRGERLLPSVSRLLGQPTTLIPE